MKSKYKHLSEKDRIFLRMMLEKHIADLIMEINNRPLKCLGFKTPQEVFLECVKESGT